MFIRRLFIKLIIKVGTLLQETNAEIGYATLPKFGNNPRNLTIELPRRIINPQHMILGDNIWLGPGSLLIAVTRYPGVALKHPDKVQEIQNFTPRIMIGNRVTSTANLQIASMNEIVIEDDVLFASNINITDGLHGYESANEPFKYQKMFRIAPIRIKQGCWIGQNVVILPGVTIGEFSIVGANSVVTRSIPDRCIAFGSPARVVKKWDDKVQEWITAND